VLKISDIHDSRGSAVCAPERPISRSRMTGLLQQESGAKGAA
jgi:hypothetical protein